MNYAIVFRLLGYVLMIEGALLLLPAAASLVYGEWMVLGVFLLTAAVSAGIGTRNRSPCEAGFRPRSDSRIAFSILAPMPFSQGCTLIVRESSKDTLATWLIGISVP